MACQTPVAFLKPSPGPAQPPPPKASENITSLAQNTLIENTSITSSDASLTEKPTAALRPTDQKKSQEQTLVTKGSLEEAELEESELTEKELAETELQETELAENELQETELQEKELQEKELQEKELIDPFLCVRGLSGNLTTGRVGRNILAEYGLVPKITLISAALDDQATISSLDDDKAPSSKKALRLNSEFTTKLLFEAYSQTGRPFLSGGRTPQTGFDEAGLVYWAYGKEGVKLPTQASQQVAQGRAITREELRPGDILVYDTPKTTGYLVGIYTGNGNFILASSKLNVVTETAAFGTDYGPYFVGARRYVDDPNAAPLSETLKTAAANGAVKVALIAMGDNIPKPSNIYGSSAKKSKTSKKSRRSKKTTSKKK